MDSINIQQLVMSIIIAINLLIAIYVLIKDIRNIVNRAFFIFVLGISLWGSGIILLCITGATFFINVILCSGHIMIFGLVLLSRVFPGAKKVGKKLWLFLVPLFLIFLLTPFGLFIKSAIIHPDGSLEPVNGPLIPLMVVFVGIYILFSLVSFIQRYKKLSGLAKLQMKYLFFGITIFIIAMFLFDVFLPAIGIYQFNLLGPITSIVFISITAYAIIRHQLMDIRIVIRRGLLYSITIAFLIIIYCLFIFILENIFRKATEMTPVISAAIAAIVIVVSFPRLQKTFQRVTDRIFFKDIYNYQEALKELNQAFNSTIDLEELSERASQILSRTLRVNRTLFLLRESGDRCLVVKNKNFVFDKKEINKKCRSFLIKFLEKNRKSIIYQELEYKKKKSYLKAKQILEKLKIAVIVPIFSRSKLSGVFMLREKLSGDPFYRQDIELLDTFSHQLGVAIENAKLYKEVKNHSKHLEDKVKERTKELRNLYDAQSRFLADISHQLQTPLSVIKGNVGIIDQKYQKSSIKSKALDIINKTVDRASNLVNDLLILARADFGQQKLNMEELNLNYLIRELYEQSKILAENKEIKFSFQEKDNLVITGDKEKLKGLFLNLISNAITYTPNRGEVKVVLHRDGKQAKVEIIDTGYGIAKKDLPHIFERFYRVKRKDKSLEGKGIGLGLAISYWIVQAHNGRIIVQSKLGNGSKFIVSFLAQKK